jgi:hypothetical protein
MRQLTIQILLIVGTLTISWRLLMSYGQKALAVRRLGLMALAAFAIWSILDPSVWTRLALFVGIGRGTDLILYGLVVAFFGYMATTYKRFRDLDNRYTRLARRLALDETPPPTSHPALAHPPSPSAVPPAAPEAEPPSRGSLSETES